MEKYCPSYRRVLGEVDFKLCPYCGTSLKERVGRQPIPGHLRHEVFKRDNYRCKECGATNKETTLEIDHIIPVSKGGTNDINNLQTLCKACNRAKSATIWDEEPIINYVNPYKSWLEGANENQKILFGKFGRESHLLLKKLYEKFNVPNFINYLDKNNYLVMNFAEEAIVREINEYQFHYGFDIVSYDYGIVCPSCQKIIRSNYFNSHRKCHHCRYKFKGKNRLFIRCPVCGRMLNSVLAWDFHKSCDNCGHKFKYEESNETQSEEFVRYGNKPKNSICPTCGKRISSDFERLNKRCPYCGHKFKHKKKKSKSSKSKIKASKERNRKILCSNCGKKINIKFVNERKKCPYCGHKFKGKYIKCPKCNFKNDSTDKFCIKCGTRLTDSKFEPKFSRNDIYSISRARLTDYKIEQDNSKKITCPKCNHQNDSANTFCVNCGAKLEKSIKINIE